MSESLVAPETVISMLSALLLFKKGTKVFFIPVLALLIDTEDSKTVIGYAKQGKDGFLYVSGHQE